MIPMRASEIAQAAGAALLQEGSKPPRLISRVSTDTRTLARGALFVALRGGRYDAHDFLEQALERGAAALLVARVSPAILDLAAERGAAVLRARGTAAALTRLASRQRELITARVVGITGSTGKTLTKDFTAAVLGSAGKVVASRGSYNNEIGVPLTMLESGADTEYLVLELGSRGSGHIRELCESARPETGVVTNIGWTHLQYFHTRDSLARAKAELLQSLPPTGRAVLNADDDYADFLRGASPCPVVTFGYSRRADVRAEDIQVDKYGKVIFTLKSKGGGKARVAVPLPGRHNVENALAAAAVGKIMGVDMESIAEGIANAETTGWRMEMISKPEEITIINDAYNANPVSMRSALMALGDISRDKRAIAVLGDMGELGPVSEKAHQELGMIAVDYGTDILITVGRKTRKTAQAAREKGLPRGSIFTTNGVDKAAEILRAIIEPGDVVLIKGSRFLGLEKLVDLVA
ncbi:MAG: UDP-N-acetylmuramoyl-tripeptide--D-alanyl-D-alanine ligase [Actinobacteria bacterium]|jgi:UDP-N-acetylmuramoyl-tripeptide--D-alanyl-D-alanine ligase|nr:MAG: UDP-N-acetylmuramoyl-tripeptide--D-alanyl-D-alanine ligase [Actinomycetota bacterium]